MTTIRPSISPRLRVFCLSTLLLFATRAGAIEIMVPLRLDFQFLNRILLEQVYVNEGGTARVLDDTKDCSTLVLSNPEIGLASGRIRVTTAADARLGGRLVRNCWHIPRWQGFIDVFEEAVIVPGQPTIEFRVVDSSLRSPEGKKPLVTGTLWDWSKKYVHPRLATFKVDLGPALQEVQSLVPLMLAETGVDAARRTLESATLSNVELADTGIVITLRLAIPEAAVRPASRPAEALPPTSESMARDEPVPPAAEPAAPAEPVPPPAEGVAPAEPATPSEPVPPAAEPVTPAEPVPTPAEPVTPGESVPPPEPATPTEPPPGEPSSPTEPALTSEEASRWEAAWQRWDAFLTFVIKQVALDSETAELRLALLEVLLDGRYDLTEALIAWKEGTPDPVRGLFLKSWERLAPILRRLNTGLPGEEAIRYLSFITAADALKAMDQVGDQVGFEISADGLRRMARMLAPEFKDDPLRYSLDVDPELRRLFNFGSPLPLSEDAAEVEAGIWFFFTPAWAGDAPDRAAAKKLNRWVPAAHEIETYLPLVGDVLTRVADATVERKGLASQYRDFFRRLSLATAWQESCWRQFVTKSGQIKPLTSPSGSIGIMQVNPNVWRGFYEVPALRSDIRYNASAGNEILHHYLVDYVFAKGEHKKKANLDHLARLAYVTYNGGPTYFERYRKQASSPAVRRVARAFWRKYQAIGKTGASAVASCYAGA